ncbi:signal peptidase I [Paenibacillus shenyangensis]|uniref:signal peptidase I n=1 Tax=Paenibacillus sp. A9 TaxID=1284352 RepID=UPI000377F3C0|nr:signal peptidase I [Paenibacillus sp. A9]
MNVTIGGLLIAAFLQMASPQNYVIDGPSMQPTLKTGDRVTVTAAAENEIHRGDLILYQAPEGREFVKRVIALPGEKVKMKGDKTWINGKVIQEPYIQKAVQQAHDQHYTYNINDFPTSAKEDNRVAPHSFFVLGDNRSNSQDSRMTGFVPIEEVKGKVIKINGHSVSTK